MSKKSYDFAGWVTKNDTLVSDGTVIRHNAFAHQDGAKVPLVWNHQHNDASNVLGNIVLHNMEKGVYGYGHFNDSENAVAAREALEHGDINAMSIAANKLTRNGANIMHGNIFEVSLVLAGANPGALIESVVSHSDDEGESAIIYPGTIIHSAEDEVEEPEMDEVENTQGEEQEDQVQHSVEDVLASMNDEQLAVVESLLSADDDDEEGDESQTQEEDEQMAHNAFQGGAATATDTVLLHSALNDAVANAHEIGSLQEALKHSDVLQDQLQHADNGVTDITTLFPEAHNFDTTPHLIQDTKTAADKIVNGTTKSPFPRIKTQQIDITEDEARARGYIKQHEKIEQIYKTMQRSTTPTTMYTKTKLDRDDILDIQDFDIAMYMNQAMKIKFNEELARAILVGDGRPLTINGAANPDKIDEEHIRPIKTEDDLYAIKATTANLQTFVDDAIIGLGDLQGSGSPSLYMNPKTVAKMKIAKKADGSYLYGGSTPSAAAIAATLGVSEIVETSLMPEDGTAIFVNLKDYVNGSVKGGQLTSFNDFDIDFNQYKALLEGRLSGALRDPKTALVMKIKDYTTVPQLEGRVFVTNNAAPASSAASSAADSAAK